MPFNDRIQLKVRRSLLPQGGIGAGLDAGGSLTKLAFARKTDAEDSEYVTVELAYFHNFDFASAIEYVKENAALNATPDTCLPATGATTTKYHELIQKVLGIANVSTFNEFNCHVQGMMFLVQNFEDDEFCDPEADYVIDAVSNQLSAIGLEGELKDARMETFRFTEDRKIVKSFAEDERGRFPFLMVMAGSGNGNFIIDANKEMIMITGTFKAGKSLIGLSSTMLDIPKNHYVELCALADNGQVKQVTKPRREAQDLYDRLNNSAESEFPFAAIDDKKEDIARALIKDFAEEQAYTIALARARTNVKNVYYGGGMALSTVMRREITAAVMRYQMKDLKLRFLKTNCTGALGAFVCQRELQEEALKVAEMMKLAAAQQQQPPAAAAAAAAETAAATTA